MIVVKSNQIFEHTIGATVKMWRKKRGLTVTNLAKKTGFTKGYLSQLENDRIRNPNDEHMIEIAKALSIPVLHLVNRVLPS